MYSLIVATMVTTGSATPSWFYGCHGCHGCYGGCWGNAFSCYGCYGCNGCYGGCYGCYGGCYGCYGSGYGTYSCYGCNGCYGGYGYYGLRPVLVPAAIVPPPPMPKVEQKSSDKAPAQARVIISIPDGARLLVNDIPIVVDPAARLFVTPQLEPGRSYYYVFKVEMQTDGGLLRDEKRVEVAAGRQVNVDFMGLATAAAARR